MLTDQSNKLCRKNTLTLLYFEKKKKPQRKQAWRDKVLKMVTPVCEAHV